MCLRVGHKDSFHILLLIVSSTCMSVRKFFPKSRTDLH